MADSSFDIVSKVDRQEVDNALNQAAKELGTRFDFRGTDSKIAWKGDEVIELTSSTEERVKAAGVRHITRQRPSRWPPTCIRNPKRSARRRRVSRGL